MKVLNTNKKFIEAIKNIVSSKPTYFYLASFNLRVDKNLTKILKSLPKGCDIKILIGVGNTVSKKQLAFYKQHFSKYNYKVVKRCHIKMVSSSKGAILGGRNYTGSEWDDLSFLFNSPEVLTKSKDSFLNFYNKRRKI